MMELYPGFLEDHFNLHKLSIGGAATPPEYMTSASAVQFAAAPVRMGVYERPAPAPVMGIWNCDPFKVDSGQATSGSTVMEADKFDTRLEDAPQVALEPARSTDQETSKPPERVLRRLAQNREAARKSRLRKKAYIQQLETSRMKLAQLEQELQRARQQVRENNPLVKAISSVPATFPDPVHWLICRVHTQMGIWETQISDSQHQWIQVLLRSRLTTATGWKSRTGTQPS
jgi:hypothetical protein